jgi:hypothetical protein
MGIDPGWVVSGKQIFRLADLKARDANCPMGKGTEIDGLLRTK